MVSSAAALAARAPHDWPRVLLAPLLVLVVVLVDLLIQWMRPTMAVHGVLDEVGHLATTGVLLAVGLRLLTKGGRPRLALLLTALACTVLIDVDHVPQVLGWDGLSKGTARPYPHSMATLVLLAAAAAVLPRRVSGFAVAALVGVSAHLVRDLGTALVPLFWPLTPSGVQVAHSHYIVLLILLALVDAVLAARRPVVIDLRAEELPTVRAEMLRRGSAEQHGAIDREKREVLAGLR